MEKAGIYLHIPFCARKCPYCDFYSRAYRPQEAALFLRALRRQIESLPPDLAADTVYFGGGTPSLLRAQEISASLDALARHIELDAGAEITLELNPATCSQAKLRDLRAAGVNRLSVGVQSTDAAVLRAAGRLHGPREALETLDAAARAGFDNLSADLMLGLPGDTPEALARSIDEVAPRAAHLSAYLLKVMEGTPFARALPARLPGEDEMAEIYLGAVERLARHGLEQYEISNFARGAARRSRHNLKYWRGGTWYGLGPAAHSAIGSRLWSFPRDLERYCAAYGPQFDPAAGFTAPLTAEGERGAAEHIMLSLRTTEGLSLKELYDLYKTDFSDAQRAFCLRLAGQGLARFDGERLSLTPRGMLVSNAILVELL